jgi:hypothetical protein
MVKVRRGNSIPSASVHRASEHSNVSKASVMKASGGQRPDNITWQSG